MTRPLFRLAAVMAAGLVLVGSPAMAVAQTSSTSITVAPPTLVVAERVDGGSFGAALIVLAVLLIVGVVWLAMRSAVTRPDPAPAPKPERDLVATTEPEA